MRISLGILNFSCVRHTVVDEERLSELVCTSLVSDLERNDPLRLEPVGYGTVFKTLLRMERAGVLLLAAIGKDSVAGGTIPD